MYGLVEAETGRYARTHSRTMHTAKWGLKHSEEHHRRIQLLMIVEEDIQSSLVPPKGV